MPQSVGSIMLDLGLNTLPLSTQIKGAAAGAQTQLNGAFQGVSAQASKAAGGIGAKFAGLFAKIGGLMAAAFAVGRVKAKVQEWQSLYQTQIESEIKIAVTMRNATNATQEQIQAVKDLASEYQQMGVIGDEVQLAGMQELATYLKDVESVKKLMPVLNDMVAQQYGYDATGGSAVGIATMLGKVMNGSTTALSRYGYDFTEAQGNIIKYGTEAEKVATVTEVIEASVRNMNEALAQTPTGKMKQLSNNFGDLKESLGSLTINLCAPFISMLNVIVVRLTQAFNALSRFVAAMMSIKSFSFLGLGKSAKSASGAIDGIAKSAGGAGKAMKSLMGFDQLNRLDGSGGGGGGGGDDEDNMPFDMEDEELLDSLTAKVIAIKKLFAEGFKIGFQSADLQAIRNHAESVRKSLAGIFTSGEVQTASRKFCEAFIKNLGKITGSLGSMDATVMENLLGGMDAFLKKRGGWLKQSIAELFDIRAETMRTAGDFSAAFAKIFSSLKSGGGKEITASLMSIFTDLKLVVTTTLSKLGRDVFGALAKPFIDNASSMKTAAEKILKPIGKIFSLIADRFHALCNALRMGYDSVVRPVLNALGDSLSKLWQNHLQSMWDKTAGFLDSLSELFGALWEKAQPFLPVIEAIAGALWKILAPLLSIFGDAVISGLGELADAIGVVFDVLSGLLSFVTGVFTGDWNKAWSGIKQAAGSLWDYIKAKFQANTIVGYFSGIWNRVRSAFSAIGTQIGGAMGSSIKNAVNSVIGQVQSRVNSGISLINSALRMVGGGRISGLSLPRLAQGGFVRANTPQLAVIGDNTRYGEIVAPEDKMLEMILTALKLFKQQDNSPKQPGNDNQFIELVVNLGDETLMRKIIKLLRDENRRGNYEFSI